MWPSLHVDDPMMINLFGGQENSKNVVGTCILNHQTYLLISIEYEVLAVATNSTSSSITISKYVW